MADVDDQEQYQDMDIDQLNHRDETTKYTSLEIVPDSQESELGDVKTSWDYKWDSCQESNGELEDECEDYSMESPAIDERIYDNYSPSYESEEYGSGSVVQSSQLSVVF
jgi:hypothetical protein